MVLAVGSKMSIRRLWVDKSNCSRDFSGGVGIRVENAGEFDKTGGGEFGVNADMVLAERTGAKDGYPDFVVGCHDPSLPLKTPHAKSAKLDFGSTESRPTK